MSQNSAARRPYACTKLGKCQARLLSHGEDDTSLQGKHTMDSSDSEDEASAAAMPSPPSALSIFHEDILLSILSYVADVPFEMIDKARAPIDSHSTLTHTLPLVSKQFRRLTRDHDLYWKHALLRLVKSEPTLWEEGLKRVVFDAKCDELRAEIRERRAVRRRDKRTKESQLSDPPQSADESKASDPGSPGSSTLGKEEALLQQACTAIESHPPHHHTATSSGIHQCLYQSIVLRHLRYQAPVFYMPSSLKLGTPYGLHFFEPRYRLLVSEAMANYPVSARRGNPIMPVVPGIFPPPQDRSQVLPGDIKASILDLLEKNEDLLRNHQLPTFIHAHQSPLRRNTPATIVQIMQCIVQADGSADVFLKPLSYIWLEEIWERPGTGGLYEARGIRMGEEASEGYERWCGMSGYGMGDGRGRGQQLPIP